MGVFSKIKTNNSTFFSKTKCIDGHKWWVSFEFYPFAVGEAATVFEGRMYNEHGYWSQSKAVVKTLNNAIGSEENLQPTVKMSEIARSLAENFYREYPDSRKLNFVMPCLAEMDSVSVFNTPFRYIKGYEKQLADNEHVLIEEFIEGDFKMFIDVNGISSEASDILDTFVHYSYVESNGDLVLCKLEGTETKNGFKMTGVTIHSREKRFGTRDQGEQGMLNVFNNHKCTDTCKNWPTPAFGLVPTAPMLSEGKMQPFGYSKGTSELFFNQSQILYPPSYEQSTRIITPKTDDKPLVHGQIKVS